MLLEKGVEIDAQSKTGTTPLYLAVYKNNKACSDLLILYGTDIELARNDGVKPYDLTTDTAYNIRKAYIPLMNKYGKEGGLIALRFGEEIIPYSRILWLNSIK